MKKWIDVANGMQNLIKVQMVRALAKSFRRGFEYHKKLNLKCWACLRQLQCTVFAVVLSQNLIKVQMARALAKSFRRASRSPAVQVTGSANALSRWDRAQAH